MANPSPLDVSHQVPQAGGNVYDGSSVVHGNSIVYAIDDITLKEFETTCVQSGSQLGSTKTVTLPPVAAVAGRIFCIHNSGSADVKVADQDDSLNWTDCTIEPTEHWSFLSSGVDWIASKGVTT